LDLLIILIEQYDYPGYFRKDELDFPPHRNIET